MQYEEFLRGRITELRIEKNVSEHRMSLDLDKSGSYIRGITNGGSLPSLKEWFNILHYFEVTPSEFFFPLEKNESLYSRVCMRLLELRTEDLEKIDMFIDWITE